MKESFYFQHDYNARNDPKIQDVLIEYGVSGIGIFWCIVEQLYEQNGLLPLKTCKSIAFALHVENDVVESIVNNFGLFKNDGENFWSNSVNSRLSKRKDVTTKRKMAASKRWKSNTDMQMQSKCRANAMQNDAKEMKEKKKKEKEIYNNSFIDIKESETQVSPKVKRFKSPTVEEIKGYCEERGINICPQKFFDYYESNGWKVGKNPMKDWKAAVRQWERREKEFSNNNRNNDVASPSYYKKL